MCCEESGGRTLRCAPPLTRACFPRHRGCGLVRRVISLRHDRRTCVVGFRRGAQEAEERLTRQQGKGGALGNPDRGSEAPRAAQRLPRIRGHECRGRASECACRPKTGHRAEEEHRPAAPRRREPAHLSHHARQERVQRPFLRDGAARVLTDNQPQTGRSLSPSRPVTRLRRGVRVPVPAPSLWKDLSRAYPRLSRSAQSLGRCTVACVKEEDGGPHFWGGGVHRTVNHFFRLYFTM